MDHLDRLVAVRTVASRPGHLRPRPRSRFAPGAVDFVEAVPPAAPPHPGPAVVGALSRAQPPGGVDVIARTAASPKAAEGSIPDADGRLRRRPPSPPAEPATSAPGLLSEPAGHFGTWVDTEDEPHVADRVRDGSGGQGKLPAGTGPARSHAPDDGLDRGGANTRSVEHASAHPRTAGTALRHRGTAGSADADAESVGGHASTVAVSREPTRHPAYGAGGSSAAADASRSVTAAHHRQRASPESSPAPVPAARTAHAAMGAGAPAGGPSRSWVPRGRPADERIPEPPVVNVTIGRIEVADVPPATRPRPQPRLGLDEYLAGGR